MIDDGDVIINCPTHSKANAIIYLIGTLGPNWFCLCRFHRFELRHSMMDKEDYCDLHIWWL